MKKVLFVATVVKKHIMVFHLPYLKWFKENGYEVHVCAHNDYEDKEDCKIPFCDKYYNLPFSRSPSNLSNIRSYKLLKDIIEDNCYSIIHCHTPVGGALARLAARKSRRKETKVVYTAHGFHFYKGAPIKHWILFYPVELFLSKFTDIIITINNEDYLIADKFKKNTRVEYIPGVGINTKKFRPDLKDRKDLVEDLNIPVGSVVILSVGELNRNKNHQVMIRALKSINKENVYYLISGVGEELENLRSLAIKLGVHNRVKFLGYRHDLADIYSQVDIFVFPSYREGLSLSLMEAMSSGLPIICSNIRGNNELIIDGIGGYLLNPNDVNGFKSKLIKLVDDSTLRKKMGQYNINKIKEYDINNVRGQLINLYQSLITSKKIKSGQTEQWTDE
ncbi:glycosyltransferase family 4 protein [Sporosarcina sp. SAFN-015]|uniref:glycosyltransferase family 4 protein n=1 Tax=Sporosarcina sp. SAFN-015 TaxID=3387274 RepID=UPI003F7D4496